MELLWERKDRGKKLCPASAPEAAFCSAAPSWTDGHNGREEESMIHILGRKEGEGKVRKRRQVAIGGKEGKGDDRCRK